MSRSKLDIKAIQRATTSRGEIEAKQEAKPEPAAQPKKPARFSTTVYPDKDFYVNIKIALLREGRDRDFNRLVNDLLKEWYEANAS